MRGLVLLAVFAGCYRPASEQACHVSCESNGPCPDGLECNNLMCTLPGGGCGETPDAAKSPDGGDDAPSNDGRMCYGTKVTVCPPDQITTDLSVTGLTTINTDNTSSCDLHPIVGTAEVCVLLRNHITIAGGGVLRAFGSRPLVLFAASALVIDGVMDVSSSNGAFGRGAGAGAAPCDNESNAGSSDNGGGAGGSFGGTGAAGGKGNSALAGSGAPGGTQPATSLRGGCDGGLGENEIMLPVPGGGAVALLSPHAVSLTGGINASGAGGNGGAMSPGGATPGGGGGGGGSGGMIVIEAAIAPATGWLRADGGGGGCGGGAGPGGPGAPSTHIGIPTGCVGLPATGGGDGASRTMPATSGRNGGANQGGGGGGGGEGVIFVSADPGTLDRSP